MQFQDLKSKLLQKKKAKNMLVKKSSDGVLKPKKGEEECVKVAHSMEI